METTKTKQLIRKKCLVNILLFWRIQPGREASVGALETGVSAGVGVSAPAAGAAGSEAGVAADGVSASGTGADVRPGVPVGAEVGVAAADGGREGSSPSSRNFLGLISLPLLLTCGSAASTACCNDNSQNLAN